jgi:hypothetical protein
MPLKHELSALVRRRIDEMGITPARLAELAKVKPERVEALLAAGKPEISIADAENIANAVGLAIGVLGHARSRDNQASAFVFAAQTASTSYRDVIPADAVRETLLTGVVPGEYRPHVRALLDEAPLGLLARLAEELNREAGVSQLTTWQVMRKVAAEMACSRDLWH